jgi:hypothetical protein
MFTKTKFNFSHAIVVLLLFFFIDEFAFVLYNISLFQYMCSNTLSLFLTDEIPLLNTNYNGLQNVFFLLNDVTCDPLFYIDHVIGFENAENESLYQSVSLHNDKDLFSFSLNEDAHINKFYKIKMEATNVKKNLLSFYPLQTYIYTIPGESTLIFYRLENLTDLSMHSLSVYVTSPAEAVAYIKKLQCFCYEELMISPKCIIDLPILFSVDEEILNEDFNEITINYILLLKDKK